MLVYNPDGVEFDKEPVDVRELVEQGWSREAPKVAEAPAEESPRRSRPSKFGSNEI